MRSLRDNVPADILNVLSKFAGASRPIFTEVGVNAQTITRQSTVSHEQ